MTIDTNTAGLEVNSVVTPQKPIGYSAKLTAANTNYDAPTNAVQVVPSLTKGGRITKVVFTPCATVTATDCQIYVSPDGGTTKNFLRAVAMGAQTISSGNTAPITPVDAGYSDSAPLVLLAGESLYAAIGVAQTAVRCRAEGGSYV